MQYTIPAKEDRVRSITRLKWKHTNFLNVIVLQTPIKWMIKSKRMHPRIVQVVS